jgi:hypothetical protein
VDDFDLLGDLPLGFEDVLDPQDLTDADLNVAELSAVDTVTQTTGSHWSIGLGDLRTAARDAHGVVEQTGAFIGDSDLSADLRAALAEVAQLPSPFAG